MKKIRAVPIPAPSDEFPIRLFDLGGYIQKGSSLQVGDFKMVALKSFLLRGLSVDKRDGNLMLAIYYYNDANKGDAIMGSLFLLEQLGIIRQVKS